MSSHASSCCFPCKILQDKAKQVAALCWHGLAFKTCCLWKNEYHKWGSCCSFSFGISGVDCPSSFLGSLSLLAWLSLKTQTSQANFSHSLTLLGCNFSLPVESVPFRPARQAACSCILDLTRCGKHPPWNTYLASMKYLSHEGEEDML